MLPDDDEIVKGDPPDARRQGGERAADGRLSVANNRRHSRHRRRHCRPVRGRCACRSMRGSWFSRPRSRSASTRRAEARPCSIMRSAIGSSGR